MYYFFFFKLKTSYEMRISDWSSDVCSSDLNAPLPQSHSRPDRTIIIMRLSSYFLPVLKENPSEAQIVSHRLMLRAGMVRQSAAGIYSSSEERRVGKECVSTWRSRGLE